MAISTTVPDSPDLPRRSDPVNFDDRADDGMEWFEGLAAFLNQWAAEANATQEAINESEQNAATSRTNSEKWASQLSTKVLDVDYSSKEWAIGSAGGQGSAKKWAITLGSTVNGTDYSSAEYAIGTTVAAGSAKKWAGHLGATVNGTEWSAKEWAVGDTVPEGSAKVHALAGKGYRDEAEAFNNSAQAAQLAAQSAAGIPSPENNGGKVLTSSADGLRVFWGDAGPRNYVLGASETVQLLSGAADQDVSIISASDFFLLSQDGTNYQLATKYSERVTGDLYISGLPATGYVRYLRDDTTALAAAVDCWLGEDSSGNSYALANNRYVIKDDPAGARIQEADLYTLGGSNYPGHNWYMGWVADNDDVFAVTRAGTAYRFPAGDLTNPVTMGTSLSVLTGSSVYPTRGNDGKVRFGYILSTSRPRYGDGGMKLYFASSNVISQWSLSSPYNESTAVFEKSIWLPRHDNFDGALITNFCFSPDGLWLVVFDGNADQLTAYSLATAWEIGSLDIQSATSIGGGIGSYCFNIGFVDNGNRFFSVSNAVGLRVSNLGVANDPTSGLSPVGQEVMGLTSYSAVVTENGSYVFGYLGSPGEITRWTLSSPYNPDTAGSAVSWPVPSPFSVSRIREISDDGTRLIDENGAYIETTTPYDFSVISASGNILDGLPSPHVVVSVDMATATVSSITHHSSSQVTNDAIVPDDTHVLRVTGSSWRVYDYASDVSLLDLVGLPASLGSTRGSVVGSDGVVTICQYNAEGFASRSLFKLDGKLGAIAFGE